MTNLLNLFENKYFVNQGFYIDHKMQEILGRQIPKLRDTILDIINGKPSSTLPQDMPKDARLRFQTFINEHCTLLSNTARSGSTRPLAYENRRCILYLYYFS